MQTSGGPDARQAHRAPADPIGPDDPRYPDLVRRGFNKRFHGQPDYVHMVGTTEQAVAAVQQAVSHGLRVVARSGGHCLEGFVADPAVRVLIDLSLMTGVYYDPEMDAFAVEAGTTVGEMYRRLFLGWGVTVPAGEHPDLGVGGHILGGAFGFLCREHGLAVDHLHAIEVVVVDDSGTARSVVATREASDPNRDLWWAHTGGGGGNFGIVTRCWFRSPGARRGDPAGALPRAPDSVVTLRAAWEWESTSEAAFVGLARNFGAWCERHAAPHSPEARMFSLLMLRRRELGTLELKAVSTAGAGAERLLLDHLAAVDEGVGVAHTRQIERSSWLAFALNPFPELFRAGSGDVLVKIKDAFLRRPFTDRQMRLAYQYMTRTDYNTPGGVLGLASYGGSVNTVDPGETAVAQRHSILTTACTVGWQDPRDEARHLAWIRSLYRDLFAETGGVPVPGDATDGAMINHPDGDLADPEWNTSGVPWHSLYYKDNYPRLQQVKARWDPRNVFHHALSIRRPG
jgi:FAD/FMN-containing dehydrogenase